MEKVQSQCRSCGAAVFWVRFASSGNLSPFDFEPVSDGNIVIDDAGKAVVLSGSMFDDVKADGKPRFKNHFATCPNSKSHRKAK